MYIYVLFAALLRRQDSVHLRLGQEETLHAVSENVLRKRRRHWRLPLKQNQSYLKAIQKETKPEKCRP